MITAAPPLVSSPDQRQQAALEQGVVIARARRVQLRTVTPGDLEYLARWADDPFLDRMVGSELLRTYKHVYDKHPSFYEACLNDPTQIVFVIMAAEAAEPRWQRPLGLVRLFNIHLIEGYAFLETMLTDERALCELGVAAEDAKVLSAGIPETVAVVPGSDDRWWADRKRWFFKPATGYGSRGSYRGNKLTRGVFAEIVKGDYVAQRLVPPTERWVAQGTDRRPLKLDLRIYVYAGTTLAVAARLYQGQTTNFRTPGGGFAPVYVIPAEYRGMPAC